MHPVQRRYEIPYRFYFSRDMLKHLAHLRRFEQVDVQELASREIEVLQLSADGLSPEQIAERLYLSPHTVKNHLRHAMAKLDSHTSRWSGRSGRRMRTSTPSSAASCSALSTASSGTK